MENFIAQINNQLKVFIQNWAIPLLLAGKKEARLQDDHVGDKAKAATGGTVIAQPENFDVHIGSVSYNIRKQIAWVKLVARTRGVWLLRDEAGLLQPSSTTTEEIIYPESTFW